MRTVSKYFVKTISDFTCLYLPCSEVAFQRVADIIPSDSVTWYFDSSLLDTASVIIKAKVSNESDCLCTLISVQDPLCPAKENLGEAMRYLISYISLGLHCGLLQGS